MNKSQMYKYAQYSVLGDSSLSTGEKLEILRELFVQEDLAKYQEKQEAEQE